MTATPDSRSQAQILLDAGLMSEHIAGLTEEEAEALLWDWGFWRRPAQVPPPGDWDAWMVLAGRGFGKTRTGSETIRRYVADGTYGRIGIVAPTAGDARDILIEGESGVVNIHPHIERPRYEPSKRRLTWSNGAIATVYSGEDPDRLRGPEHDFLWIDEPASMQYGQETLDNARLGLRIGKKPRLLVTGTPRPRPWLRRFSEEPTTVVTTGSTYANIANLAASFIEVIVGRYEGTRLGRQELHAEWLDDVEGALFTAEMIDRSRFPTFDPDQPWPSLAEHLTAAGRPAPTGTTRAWRTIVAVDPPAETAECGIIVATAPRKGIAGVDHAVVLADASLTGRPEHWGSQVVQAFRQHRAEAVYVESNQGGDMVRATIHAVDPSIPVKKVTARQTKQARAEPIAALYERGWVHHAGFYPALEDQMQTWVPGESRSPDRLDALVHAVRELLVSTNVVPVRTASAVHRRI